MSETAPTGPVRSHLSRVQELTAGVIVTLALLAAPLLASGCAEKVDQPFCSSAGCEFSAVEWQQISSLAGLPETPPVDPTNKYIGNPGAEAFGRAFFFDPRFSGPSTQQDSLKRPVSYARTAKGVPTNISCATCHDLRRGGIDTSSIPGNVAIGAGWADTNSIPAFNASFYGIQYWTGRADSMWAQAVSSSEGNNMNGNRMATAWIIQDHYRDPKRPPTWEQVFTDPWPITGTSADVKKLIDPATGQCKLNGTACPTELGCRAVAGTAGGSGCWPRFPLEGKLGTKKGCQPGDPEEPSGDAFDCMDPADQEMMTRLMVNWAKALAAYEWRLVSRDSAFDRWVAEAKAKGSSKLISPEAQRGARLFVGKAACNDCHNTPLMSDSQFYNIGVAQVGTNVPTESDCPDGWANCDCVPNTTTDPATGKVVDPMAGVRNCLPWGARGGLLRLRSNEFKRDSVWSDDTTDTSRKPYLEKIETANIDKLAIGAWRTPSLRDVALTAPYMHNGSIATLEDVVWHYHVGGSGSVTGNRSPRIKPLGLTESEQRDLVSFLKTLTGAPLPAELVSAPPLAP